MLINTVTPSEIIKLKTYSEIVAMATAEWYQWSNTLAELNTYPQEYYNMLDSESHLVSQSFQDPSWTYKHIIWIWYTFKSKTYLIFYNQGTWSIWYVV